jgi:hypothetical protein
MTIMMMMMMMVIKFKIKRIFKFFVLRIRSHIFRPVNMLLTIETLIIFQLIRN